MLQEQGHPLPSDTAAPEDKPAAAEVEQTAEWIIWLAFILS
jgi:hypothetical protein